MTSGEQIVKHFDDFLAEAKLEKKGRMKDGKWFLDAVELLKSRNNTLKNLYDEIAEFAVDVFTPEESAMEALKTLLEEPNMKKSADEMKANVLKTGGYDTFEALESGLKGITETNGIKFGDLMQVLRIRLTGKTKSPDLIAVMKMLGRDNVLKRMAI
jgi:glutamyl-tRNA synthetase